MALITLTDAQKYKRPGSPIDGGDYWGALLDRASLAVQGMTGRQLASATYTDKAELVKIETSGEEYRYVHYLSEPTGSAIAYASLTITVDGSAVAEADVMIEPARLVFSTGGEIVVSYPGGWMRDTTAGSVIRSAVIRTMEILHQRESYPGLTGSMSETLMPEWEAFEPVRAMLMPFTAVRLAGPYAVSPGD